MAMVSQTCLNCGKTFQTVRPEAKFCSNLCVGGAKSKGLIGTKKRRGKTLTCEICGKDFYRKPYHVKAGRNRFCSEACRKRAWATEQVQVNRASRRQKLRKGKTIACMFCGQMIYRKKSMLERNIGKTCGHPICVSSYGRSLWGLNPVDPELLESPRNKRKQIYRRDNNFTAAQRLAWIDTKCSRCGSTKNLALDHIIPVCAGGKATKDNAQTLCQPCNNWKAENIDRPLARQQLLSGG